MDLKTLSDEELGKLDLQVKAEIARRNDASTNIYWIDDSGVNKTRDMVKAFHKVLPAEIEKRPNAAGDGWLYFVKKSDQAAFAWVQQTAQKYGWELIPQ
jgi:predicted dinucleotide-binding enzyme